MPQKKTLEKPHERERSEGSRLLDDAITKQKLTNVLVAASLTPAVSGNTVQRWRAGTREPESRGHRIQLREMFEIPLIAWQLEVAEQIREAWIAKHPPSKDPKQLELPETT